MYNKDLYKEFREELSEVYMADAHSHIAPETAWKQTPVDFLTLMDYSSSDIVSAGMDRDLWVQPVTADSRMRLDYGYSDRQNQNRYCSWRDNECG